MKKINVALNSKSIDDAIKELKNAQVQLKSQMLTEFMIKSCQWIVDQANDYLDKSDIGRNVIDDIKSHWSFDPSTNPVIITNTSDKAAFVEFGVGIVGQENPHDNASSARWKYNVPSQSKYAGEHHDENTWRFYVGNKDDIDLEDGNYEQLNTKSGRIKVITRGSPAVMYAYQAIVDARQELRSGGGIFKKFWNETMNKYW